jgi:hypothetical protein
MPKVDTPTNVFVRQYEEAVIIDVGMDYLFLRIRNPE